MPSACSFRLRASNFAWSSPCPLGCMSWTISWYCPLASYTVTCQDLHLHPVGKHVSWSWALYDRANITQASWASVILQREVMMAGRLFPIVGNLAFDPDFADSTLENFPDRAGEFRYGKNWRHRINLNHERTWCAIQVPLLLTWGAVLVQ